MIDTIPPIVPAVILGGLIGGIVGWVGNYHVQSRIHRRFQGIDDLKHGFYNYLELTSNYWLLDRDTSIKKRCVLEARMIAAQRIILTDYSILRKHYKHMRTSHQATEEVRVDLWDAATGGCFQQEQDWQPDPTRVNRIADSVARIVKTFY